MFVVWFAWRGVRPSPSSLAAALFSDVTTNLTMLTVITANIKQDRHDIIMQCLLLLLLRHSSHVRFFRRVVFNFKILLHPSKHAIHADIRTFLGYLTRYIR